VENTAHDLEKRVTFQKIFRIDFKDFFQAVVFYWLFQRFFSKRRVVCPPAPPLKIYKNLKPSKLCDPKCFLVKPETITTAV
jgi:hypothetical protein